VVLALAVVITAGLVVPIPNAVIDTDPENMLRPDEPVRLTHDRIKDEFSLADFLVVGFVGDADLLTPEFVLQLERLVEVVESLDGVIAADIIAPSTVDDIYRTSDGALAVKPLTEAREGWPQQPRLASRIQENPILRGKLASQDGRAVALYIPLEEKKYAHDVAAVIEAELISMHGFGEYHITGLPIAEETFGRQMFLQMGISAPLAGLFILLLMLLFFRKVSVVLVPMIVAIMTVSWTMGLLILSGFTVHIMSSMIAIFLMPIAVLDAIHVLSEFHDRFQASRSRKEAIVSTINELYAPMLFTTVTTCVGFLSLFFAPIPPVRVFGGFVAIGVAAAWLLTVSVVPAYIMLLPERVLATFGSLEEGRSALGRFLPRLGRFAVRARHVVVIVALVAAGVAVLGITRIEVNDNPTKWFKKSHPIRVAEQALSTHLAGTYMAYLEFDATEVESGSVKNPETLHLMDGLQRRLSTLPQVGSTTGISDIVKKVRYELKDGEAAAYSIPDDAMEIAQELFLYEASGGDAEDLFKFITPDGDKAVLWLQLKDGDNQSVAAVVDATESYLAGAAVPAGMQLDWAGLTYINVVWQEKMVLGMRNALLGSFGVVLVMMALLLRSLSLGIIAMIPLSVTIAFVYGSVGLLGKSYDMPIAVLSSLTLGLSIDFAIHFLKRGQEIYKRRGSARATIDELFEEPARAITRNIVVIALGFVPLLFSALVPYVTVGVFFLAIMGLSGFATLVILPGLLSFRGEGVFLPWGARTPSPSDGPTGHEPDRTEEEALS
jgi:predicted RND superfamily exporter protein